MSNGAALPLVVVKQSTVTARVIPPVLVTLIRALPASDNTEYCDTLKLITDSSSRMLTDATVLLAPYAAPPPGLDSVRLKPRVPSANELLIGTTLMVWADSPVAK